MNFTNPWRNATNFVDLGEWNVSINDGDGYRVLCRDLYALEHLDEGYVDFGCRYSNDEPDYASGFATRNNDAAQKHWTIYGSGDIQAAAARYFANRHPEMQS